MSRHFRPSNQSYQTLTVTARAQLSLLSRPLYSIDFDTFRVSKPGGMFRCDPSLRPSKPIWTTTDWRVLCSPRNRSRWEATFVDRPDIADLKAAVKKNGRQSPCVRGLRSICWKVSNHPSVRQKGRKLMELGKAFLLFNDLDRPKWTKTLSDSRSAYNSMKEHFLKNIENPDDLVADDPLSDSDSVSSSPASVSNVL